MTAAPAALDAVALVLGFAAAAAWPLVLLDALGFSGATDATTARRRLAIRAALLLVACCGAVAAWSAAIAADARVERRA